MPPPLKPSRGRTPTAALVSFVLASLASCLCMFVLVVAPAHADDEARFDVERGHSAFDLIIPTIRAGTLKHIAAGDASLILRTTTLVTNGWFDAIAPYHASAVGLHSHIARRPAAEGVGNRHRNIAMLYATYRILASTMPYETATWRAMLVSAGLDPDDESTEPTTAVGIGNIAGAGVLKARLHDGMNQLGDDHRGVRRPYADTTGYRPVNSAYVLRDPSRWQPDIVTGGHGIFRVQQGVTPQWGATRPYTVDSIEGFRAPPPAASQWPKNARAYRAQVDEILTASAALTDEQKMIAELFQHKFFSLGRVAGHVATSRGMTLEQFVHYDFMVNVAAFDGGIAAWREKYRHDAVRPFSAVRFVHRDRVVSAWGGPSKGTVSDLPGSQWRSYLPVADHPEYPSGSACFCAAHAQASRRYLGSDALGWQVAAPRGSSVIEPGVTPKLDMTLSFDTWTRFETACADSRVHAGVHFRAAVQEGAKLCRGFGDRAYELVSAHIDGTVRERSKVRVTARD